MGCTPVERKVDKILEKDQQDEHIGTVVGMRLGIHHKIILNQLHDYYQNKADV